MDDMKNEMVNSLDGFVGEIKQIIDSARANAVRSVDLCRVQMYWNNGSYLIKNLSKPSRPTMVADFRCVSSKCAVSFTALTRLRIQCVRN